MAILPVSKPAAAVRKTAPANRDGWMEAGFEPATFGLNASHVADGDAGAAFSLSSQY